jgi:hypothetical protein
MKHKYCMVQLIECLVVSMFHKILLNLSFNVMQTYGH